MSSYSNYITNIMDTESYFHRPIHCMTRKVPLRHTHAKPLWTARDIS